MVTGFLLSPGITPFLTDFFVLELPLLLAGAYALWRGRGFEVALGLNALALGIVKFATDFADPPDVIVALAGILGGLAIGYAALRRWELRHPRAVNWRLFGVLVGLVGLFKAVRDFYDPFDLLLADTAMMIGAILFVRAAPPTSSWRAMEREPDRPP